MLDMHIECGLAKMPFSERRESMYQWLFPPTGTCTMPNWPLERGLLIKSNISSCTLWTTSTEKLASVEAKTNFLRILSLCETPLYLHFIFWSHSGVLYLPEIIALLARA